MAGSVGGCKIFCVGHMFHPGDGRAVQAFLNGDVAHGLMRCRAMPVLVLGGTPQDVAGVKLQLRPAFDLGPAHALGDDQGLAQRVGVPGRACAGLEPHQGAADTGRRLALELSGDRDAAGEVVGRSLDRLHVGLAGDVHDGKAFLGEDGWGGHAECGGQGGEGAAAHDDNARPKNSTSRSNGITSIRS